MNRCPHCDQTHANTNHFCPVTGRPIELGPRLIATKLLDKYQVVSIVGSGPIGIVLEVEDITTKQHYAAKLIHPKFTRSETEAAYSLMADMAKVSTIDSPHIAKIFKVGRDTGTAIAHIRELMTGECLASRLAQIGQFSLKAALSITRQILLALDAIHAEGLLNLDLSPADIFLATTATGSTVKLVDIGERHVKQTLSGDLSGMESVKYYAPEQYDRTRQPNHRSDIYAAGAILYHMLTGTAPAGDAAPIESFRKDIPTGVAQLVMKAISPTANNRFQNAKEFIAAIDGINIESPQPKAASATGQEDSASSDTASVIVEMPEIQKSGSRIALWVVAILLIAVGGLGWFVYNGSNAPDKAPPREVTIRVEIVPENASITVDGNRIGMSPAQLTVQADTTLHTVAAKADGYEPMERDVKFDTSKTVKLELMEIIQPDDAKEAPVIATPAPIEDVPTTDTAVEAPKAMDAPKTSPAGTNTSTVSGSSGSKKPLNQRSTATKPKKRDKNQASKTPTKAAGSKKEKRIKGFTTKNPFE